KGALNRWEPDNTQSNYPRADAYLGINVNSEAYSFAVQNGSFLRLKTLQISYNLAVKKLKWLKGASVYATGSNLFILDHYTWGYDPEVSSNSGSPVRMGQDTYAYPGNRSFIFGINLKF
ncbi:MAG: TonB-dependent receptor, partial [Ginsengibacter sp.]